MSTAMVTATMTTQKEKHAHQRANEPTSQRMNEQKQNTIHPMDFDFLYIVYTHRGPFSILSLFGCFKVFLFHFASRRVFLSSSVAAAAFLSVLQFKL